ncbi:MAG: potassium channel family protein [Halobacteriota archaeon]
MLFIVVGFGRVGARTARVLHEEGHDVVVVENDHAKAERALERGLTVVEGDGSDESVLVEAGLESAAAVGAITGDIETNRSICAIAREYGVRTVLRISEDVSRDMYERYAAVADEVIYPERLGAAGAKTALLGGSLNTIGELSEELQLTVVTIPEGAPVIGHRITDLDLPERSRLYAHGRRREPLEVPLPGTSIQPDDRVALLIERDAVDDVERALLGTA